MKYLALAVAFLAAASAQECALPSNARDFSVVTIKDAKLGAHSFYKGMIVGGTLTDTTPNEDATVDRTKSFIGAMDSSAPFRSNFNGGKVVGHTEMAEKMREQLEYVATHAVDSQDGNYKVKVVTKGGTYSLDDFCGADGQGEDNGNTLAIFNTAENVYITKSQYSRQFGPTILAPFATVYVLGDAGYVDGSVYAKALYTTGGNDGQLQFHGDTYMGPITCEGGSGTPPTPEKEEETPEVQPEVQPEETPEETPEVRPEETPEEFSGTCSKLWEQCGGSGWTGDTTCALGSVCEYSDPGYSQCRPAPQEPGTVNEWGQCGGNTYKGPTTCKAGTTCVYINPGYSQCKQDPDPKCPAPKTPSPTDAPKTPSPTDAPKTPPPTEAVVREPEPECKEDQNCPQIACIQAPCPTNQCIDGTCVLVEPEPECKVDDECPQPTCLEGYQCPGFECIGGQCVQEETTGVCYDDALECWDGSVLERDPDNNCQFPKCPPEPECKDDTQCPQPRCQEGYNCPSFQCIGGECVQDEPGSECWEDAKVCSDGSTVERDPNNMCMFKDCPEEVLCTADVKECEDGSFVNRQGPNCEFAECPATPLRVEPPKGGGDPHFKTWAGHKFDYHGECDLVLLDHPNFDEGTGLKIHIRTTRIQYFSFIETIAIQIGDETLEFSNDLDNFLINGKAVVDSSMGSKNYLAGYEIRRYQRAISVRLDKRKRRNNNAHVDLYYRKNGFPYVKIDNKETNVFEGSTGLLGDYATGKMMGRGGDAEIMDPTEFALEWQVRDTEPMLFSDARFPQFPTQCTPPNKKLGKRLGDSHMQNEAEKACAAWGDDKDECIFDVMATRSIHSAETIGRHHEGEEEIEFEMDVSPI